MLSSGHPVTPDYFKSLKTELSRIGALSNHALRNIWQVDRQTALRRAKRLVEEGWLIPEGKGKGRRYKPGPKT